MRITTLKVILCGVALLCAVSCNSSKPTDPASPSLYGAWGAVNTDQETGIRTYERLTELAGRRSGYEFGLGGSLVIRNSGWCGTPPLTFFNFEGSWQKEEDRVLTLTYHDLGVVQDFCLEVVALSARELRCRIERIE